MEIHSSAKAPPARLSFNKSKHKASTEVPAKEGTVLKVESTNDMTLIKKLEKESHRLEQSALYWQEKCLGLRIALQKLALEKEQRLKSVEGKNEVEVAKLQAKLAAQLESLNKLKEERRELETSLAQSKDHGKQIQADIEKYKMSKARAELELAENLADPINFVAAARMLNPRELYWVSAQLGMIMSCKGVGNPQYYQYPMMPIYGVYNTGEHED